MRQIRARQLDVLRFIYAFTEEHGYQPSFREVSLHFGWSAPHSIVCHLRVLRRHGYLGLGTNQSRALRLLKTPEGEPFRGFVCKEIEQSDGKGGMI